MPSTENRWDTEVQFLKGVGPKWAQLMGRLNLRTVADVLQNFPRRYEDRTNLPPIRDLREGTFATVRGKLLKVTTRPIRGGKVIIQASVSDGSGTVTLTWFNQPWLRKKLETYSGEVIAYGAVKASGWAYEIASPELELIEDDDDAEMFSRVVPVYGLTEGLPQKVMRKAAQSAVDYYLDAVADPLPDDFLRAYHLKPLRWSLTQIHFPNDDAARAHARRRIVFEEFLYMQLAVQLRRRETKQELGIKFDVTNLAGKDPAGGLFSAGTGHSEGESLWDEVHRMLPFDLTGAQRRVIEEIWSDMSRPQPMNRLVQGDVGSGKTAVAACAMLAAVRCGYQAALMAPTEILAEQHAMNLRRLFEPIGIHVVLLTGKLGAREKKKAIQQAQNGEAQIVLGTHALISESVQFHNLGLAVIDEQHRFGVVQRATLRQKGREMPDVLVMTATPIPRTLTMTMYGDLDVSIIDELPPGRKPIKTKWMRPSDRERVYEGVRALIDQGRQAYFVCAMITESEKMQTQAAEDLHYRLSTEVFTDLKVELLHGQMKAAEKEAVMDRFRSGESHVLVSTVVIEVGVDVPNATVMVIEDANRFGLAQLHQLRGRVGRGQHQSHCILIADAKGEETSRRLNALVQSTDGFEIAEVDLEIRGPGEIAGTRQSGQLDFKLADLVHDMKLLEGARQAAMELLERDPDLSQPQHARIAERVKARRLSMALVTVS